MRVCGSILASVANILGLFTWYKLREYAFYRAQELSRLEEFYEFRKDDSGSKKLDSAIVSKHCNKLFEEERKGDLAGIADIDANQVCKANSQILKDRDELVNGIKSKIKCD